MRKIFVGLMLSTVASFSCDEHIPEPLPLISSFSASTLKIEDFNSLEIHSSFTIKGAKEDIKNRQVKILFAGGFGGMPDFENIKDQSFQKKYDLKFLSQGCIRFGNDEDEEGYNKEVFNFLDLKFGKAWRKEIRPDAIGLK